MQFFIDELFRLGFHVHLHQQGLLNIKAMTAGDQFTMLARVFSTSDDST